MASRSMSRGDHIRAMTLVAHWCSLLGSAGTEVPHDAIALDSARSAPRRRRRVDAGHAGTGAVNRASPAGHDLQGAGIHVQQNRGRHLPRRRHRQPRRHVQRHRDRIRKRRARRRFARLAGRRVGVARRTQGHYPEANSLRRQLALSLRSLAWQSDLRARGADHRARVRARDDPCGQIAGLTRAA